MIKRRLIPESGRILVRQAERITQSKGGIALPDTAQQQPNEGTVVHRADDSRFKIEDRVMFMPFAGISVEGNEPLILLRDSDVMCRILEIQDE